MKVQDFNLRNQIAVGLILLLGMPLAQAAPRQQQTSGQQQDQTRSAPGNSRNLPEAPGAQQQANTQQQQQSGAQQPASTQTTPEPQPGNPAEPVGTAAAPYESPVGAAVSRPAGAVIAPAKQKRRHTFLIRMGLVVGAAVAIGTVVALSKASPNRPN